MKSNPTPQPSINGLTFFPLAEFDALTAAFGAGPEHYFDRRNLPEVPRKFEDMAESLFFSGGKLPEFPKDVDRAKAGAAVRALLSSFAPAHEAKIATVAYALWVWTTPQCRPEKVAA